MRKLAGPCVAPPPSVVLVSSETESRSLLQSILQKAQCRTFACARCRDAVDLIHLASVVICERFLPDGSWLDVLRAAQALPKAPGLIVTSRLADTALWAEVLHLGGHDVLSQPFQAEEVMWTVRSVHDRHVRLPEAPSESSTERGRSAISAQALR